MQGQDPSAKTSSCSGGEAWGIPSSVEASQIINQKRTDQLFILLGDCKKGDGKVEKGAAMLNRSERRSV